MIRRTARDGSLGSASADRRAANAATTRRAVAAAARRLFAERGYFRTTIDDIAALARVSPATVYAQCGGKQGLLRTLMERWTEDDTFEQAVRVATSEATAEGKLAALGEGASQEFARLGDVIQLVHEAAYQDADAAAYLVMARQRHRRALGRVVVQLRGTDRLFADDRDEVVVDKILFHLRHQQLALLIHGFGWDPADALAWVVERMTAAVLRPARPYCSIAAEARW